MADFNRCFCGGIPVTVTGLCAKHKHQERLIKVERTCEEKLHSAQEHVTGLEREVRELRTKLESAKFSSGEYHKILVLVACGDIPVEKIDAVMDDIKDRRSRMFS